MIVVALIAVMWAGWAIWLATECIADCVGRALGDDR